MKAIGLARVNWVLLTLLVLAGVLATIRHYAPLPPAQLVIEQNIPPGPDWYLVQMPLYSQHAVMTFLHVVPAFLFVLLASIQLMPSIRRRYPVIHRWNGRLFVLLGISIGLSGLAMAVIMPFGGMLESIGTVFIAGAFLFSLFMGVYHIRGKNIAAHRAWMTRMLAIGFSPITMRFFFTGFLYLSDIPARDVFALCMLFGVIVNLAAVEWWMKRGATRPVDREQLNMVINSQ